MLSTARRFLLKATLAGAAALSVPAWAGRAFAAAPAASTVAGNVTLITGAGANVLALKARDGTVLVDSGAEGQTGARMATLAQVTQKQPGATPFNTTPHLDKTGGNPPLRNAGATNNPHQ